MAERQYRWPPGFRGRIFTRDTRYCNTLGETTPHCRIEIPGVCTHLATCIDHIIDALDGGAWFDEMNCRGACFDCNQAKRNKKLPTRLRPTREYW
jgi:5-methylcytosine-specific restriction endonuclease McrA